VLSNSGRPLNHRKVEQLQRSIADQGLLYPLHAYRLRNASRGKFGLAAGQHRLHALKNLGRRTVSVVVITREQAKAWRASENLHRNSLGPLETSVELVRYAEAREQLPNVENKIPRGGKQPAERGYKKLAKATGFDRKRIAEAYAHAALSKSIRHLILKQPTLNKRATLNLIARIETEEEQLRYIRGHSQSGLGKAKSTTSIERSGRSKRPKAKRGASMALEALRRAWKASTFRSRYEQQPPGVRKAFVRELLNRS
jgi:ParB family transcriptional regulator, chromosome partitioning protein